MIPRLITPALVAGAVAAAITAAPAATAATTRTCDAGGASTICQNPGNVEVHAEPQMQAPQIYGPFSSPIPYLFD